MSGCRSAWWGRIRRLSRLTGTRCGCSTRESPPSRRPNSEPESCCCGFRGVKSRRFKPLYGKRLSSKIKELGDARRLDDVFALLAVSQIPTTPNGRKITVGAALGAFVKCKELEVAYKLLMKLDDVDECGAGAPAYSALMLGFAREGRLIEALELLSRWEKGRGPKSSKFGVGKRGNIILRGSWKWNRADVPPFKKRDDMGTEWHPKRTATTRMLFAALDACATNGDVKRTRKFMKRIMNWEGRVQEQKNFNEEEYLWNALVKACARSKDAMMCLNVLPEMQKAGVKPTRVTYNITLSACAKAGRPDWCRALQSSFGGRAAAPAVAAASAAAAAAPFHSF